MDANGLSRVMPEGIDLFDRVVSILEQARANVVRSVNNNMVIAYWLIGREIVQEIQGGGDRAEYGKQVIEQLSAKLTGKYGRGFSTTNLHYIRTFYLVYSDRVPEIRHIGCGEFKSSGKRHNQSGVLDDMTLVVEQADAARGFSPNLGWSHPTSSSRYPIGPTAPRGSLNGWERTMESRCAPHSAHPIIPSPHSWPGMPGRCFRGRRGMGGSYNLCELGLMRGRSRKWNWQ